MSCHCEMLRLNTRGELEWHFWLHNQNEEEKRWTLSRNNRTSRQNNFTRATKAHYEIRALPSCGTHTYDNHKISTIHWDILRLASSIWAWAHYLKMTEFQIVKKIKKHKTSNFPTSNAIKNYHFLFGNTSLISSTLVPTN